MLSSASSDYLSSSTTLHQHTQTHSTRLVAVTTDTKRKIPIPLPATTLIKIETDGSIDQTKTLQAVSTIANNSGMFTDQTVPPLVTTHVIYQHPTTNLIVSQTPVLSTDTTSCRSQATSPAMTTLTPPPETLQIHEEEPQIPSTVQDASNQTDTPICSEDDNTVHTIIADVVETTDEKTVETGKVEPTTTVTDYQLQNGEMEQSQEEQKSEIIEDQVEPQDCNKITQNSSESPDLSGLELLSNSIVEFERTVKQQPEESTVVNQPTVSLPPVTSGLVKEPKEELPAATSLSVVDDSLGGLDLLCALAEQRILEEKNDKPSKKERKEKSKERHKDRERRKEKRKSKKHSLDEPKRKKLKHRSSDKEHRKRDKRHSPDNSDKEKQGKCECQYKHYKTPESEQEVKRFLDSKNRQNFCCQDWPCMNAMEMDMRIKLAELQREYREKQKELSQLKPKKHSHECSKKKSRKKSTTSERSVTPVEVFHHQTDLDTSPLLTMETIHEECHSTGHKRRHSRSSDSSPEKSSSSKKRKVGRPKRLMSDGGELVGTETIVARKLKSSFVGCLLAAKEKLKQQLPSPAATPPRYIEETTYTHKLKKVKNNNNTIILSDDIKSSNIRPKLKAEPTIKTVDDEDMINDWHFSKNNEEVIDHIEEDIDDGLDEENTSNENFSDSLLEKEESLPNENVEEEVEEPAMDLKESLPNPCALTEALLEVDKLRVLTAMGGLFYAGQLNAIEPPDVYSITLDGERGNRPHIMSREEILRDAVSFFVFCYYTQGNLRVREASATVRITYYYKQVGTKLPLKF